MSCRVAIAAGMIASHSALAQDTPRDIQVAWGADDRTLEFSFRGQRFEYPRDLSKGAYPAPGLKPAFQFEKHWPVVTMRARWTVPVGGWPEQYRKQALDLMLMYACDAQLYTNLFPEFIKSSSITVPPEFLAEARDPERYRLAEAMHGKVARYEITASAGFGAADYKIRTKMRIGLSADGKTLFYHDSPDYISDHLTQREFVFAAQDVDEGIRFEVVMLCVCKPRWAFRGETMRRIENNGRYYVERLHENLDATPTADEIKAYLERVLGGSRKLNRPGPEG